ncbi:hypothetical protein OG943_40365 [Amycolatopsis sp. NBC_00345]|uniref:hypothetical protein n=1 Tax=Amycolatopsis sp. NBC_00345 TaxID=2975955 RepID=UPI002E26682B
MAEQRDHSERADNPGPGPTPADGTQPVPPEGSAASPQPGLPQPSTPQQDSAAQTPAPQQNPAESGQQLPALPQPSDAQPALDPEQLRQFQQFQQFQDYLRFTQAQQGNQPAPSPDAGLMPTAPYQQASHQLATQQGGQPPVPPGPPGALAPYEEPRRPRRGAPRWLKRLGGKVLGWVIVLLLIGIAATWAYRHFFPSDDGKSSAQIAAEGGGTYHTNHIFSTNPYEAVRFVYHNIAQGRVDDACGRFREDVQTKFAQDVGQPDCRVAVQALHKQVTNMNDYAESLPSYVSGPPPADVTTIDSCTFAVSGGPALGVFQVTEVDKGQWLITGHSPGPEKCSPSQPSTTPTS